MGCLWGLGMSIMGCELKCWAGCLLWDGHGEGKVTNYYGMLALGPTVKKLAKNGYYGMSGRGRVSCKRSAIV